ncbi:hypothetical protein ACFXKW_32075 [Streptomyces sp. NPDC059193]|uniref:hypothetical protein n=1 Tax=Streptomyces sp. NPDC059193 TaxID=3346763 RepID=UPI00369C2B16
MGLGVLVARGMAAYLRAAAALSIAAAPRAPAPQAAQAVACELDVEVIRVWSRMVWAHADPPRPAATAQIRGTG